MDDKIRSATTIKPRIEEGASPHEVLGVPKDADLNQIKAAFRSLAMQHHPDSEGGDKTGTKMRLIQDAYETITSSNKSNKMQEKLRPVGILGDAVDAARGGVHVFMGFARRAERRGEISSVNELINSSDVINAVLDGVIAKAGGPAGPMRYDNHMRTWEVETNFRRSQISSHPKLVAHARSESTIYNNLDEWRRMGVAV